MFVERAPHPRAACVPKSLYFTNENIHNKKHCKIELRNEREESVVNQHK